MLQNFVQITTGITAVGTHLANLRGRTQETASVKQNRRAVKKAATCAQQETFLSRERVVSLDNSIRDIKNRTRRNEK